MPKKKLRHIYDWKKEHSRKQSGRLNPAAPLAFRAKRNKRENKHTIIAEQVSSNDDASRRGGQWHGQVKIAEDFDQMHDDFMRHFEG